MSDNTTRGGYGTGIPPRKTPVSDRPNIAAGWTALADMHAAAEARAASLEDDLEAAYGQRDDNWRKLCEVSAALALRQRVVDAAVALAPMLIVSKDDDPERFAQFWPEAAELRRAVAELPSDPRPEDRKPKPPRTP